MIITMFRRSLIIVFALTWGALCTPLAADGVRQEISDLHDRYKIDRDHAGIYFMRLDSGRPIYRQNHNEPFVPASNMKIITAFVALNELGTDARFNTELYVDRSKKKKHLYIRGGGDPTISRHSSGSHTAIFERWAKKLKKQGHEQFSGNLYLDHTAYERQLKHPTWAEYKHSFWYTAPVGALNYNDNCVLVTVTPDRIGQPANVSVKPEGPPVKISNKTETVRKRSRSHIDFHRKEGTWIIEVSGGIRPNTARKEWITVPYPSTYFGSVLKEVFKNQEIPIHGKTRLKPVPERILQRSPDVRRTTPVTETLDRMLKDSQNLFAETILKKVSHSKTNTGSWNAASEIVKRTLRKARIPTKRNTFVDGSGLSRKNRLTPRTLASVLQKWIQSPEIKKYISSLPISGSEGTMEHRLNHPPYRKDVAAKTGTLSSVKALTGIAGRTNLTTDNGPVILFSIIVNQQDLPPGNARVFVDKVARVAHDLTRSTD